MLAHVDTSQPKNLFARVLRDDRLRRVLHGGASALLNRGVTLLVQLISLPLATRYLGPERYGIWVTVTTSISMLSILDLGIANSLTNRISHAYAADDERAAQNYYATAFWLSVALAVVVGALGWMLWPHLHLERLVRAQTPGLARQASTCYAIAFVFFLLGFPLNLSHRVLGGYQKMQIVYYSLIFSSIGGLLSIVAGMCLHVGLVTLLLFFSGAQVAGNLLLNLWLTVMWKPGHAACVPAASEPQVAAERLRLSPFADCRLCGFQQRQPGNCALRGRGRRCAVQHHVEAGKLCHAPDEFAAAFTVGRLQ